MGSVLLELLNQKHSIKLAEIIGTDKLLHQFLSPSKPMTQVNAQEFFSHCTKWSIQTSSILYAILLENHPIGQISLSHINFKEQSAKCGYWVASTYWDNGTGTKAFLLILKEARLRGILTLTGTIDKTNFASIALWKKHGAIFKDADDPSKIIPILKLE